MPRSLFAAALFAAAPALGAQAQTAVTDTAPVRPAQALEASADARLPAFVATDSLSTEESARRLAAFYDRQADLFHARAQGDESAYAVTLDDLVADVQAAALRPGALAEPRFRALYASVMTEYELFYERPVLDRGDAFAINRAGIDAVERGFDRGAPLLEHVTLPDLDTFVSTVPMDVNTKVERYLQFLLNRPSHVQRLRSRADTYFPMVERVLAEEGVPDELKYLAMVESALNPTARSHAAAVGMWQFISATGRAYGLRAEREIDDRMDPEVATRAAARHLRDLYDRFGDWQLALAGYNCNPAVIARGVRRFEERTGQKATFWDIDHVIPRETRAYVPMFIATSLVLSNPDAYGFEPHEPGPAFTFDRIPVAGGTALGAVARVLDVEVEVLSALNPSLRQSRVPDVRVPHMLRIPVGTHAEHAQALARFAPPEASGPRFAAETVHFGTRAVRPLAPQDPVEGALMAASTRSTRRSLQPRRAVRTSPVPAYVAEAPAAVLEAEADYAAAERAQERTAGARPRLAEVPTVATAVAPPEPVASAASALEDEPAEAAEAPSSPRPTVSAPVRAVSAPAATAVHTVQRGEYLLRVARDYGMSLEALRALNPGVGDVLEVGQELRVSGSPAAPAARPAAPRRPTVHRVQRNEHLTGIARRYGVTVRQLRDWNDLRSDVLHVGQRLRLRASGARG